MAGPFPYPESPYPESTPQQPVPPGQPPFYGEPVLSPYPAMMPPAVSYPVRPRRRPSGVVALVLLVVTTLAVVAALVVYTGRRDDTMTAGSLSDAAAETAIQTFMDALSSGDQETIARNASCGLFDELKDRRSDMALASLASDAFQRQFSSAKVTSIDKIVVGSPNQAQALFTMKAVPAGRKNGSVERQGVAQLLIQGRDVLVCSYLPRVSQY